jgi:hypothetical protein
MRDIKNKLTSSKNSKNIQNRRGKSFGYQVLGFGAGGGAGFEPGTAQYLVIAGGGGGGGARGGGGGAGGFRTASCLAVEGEPVEQLVDIQHLILHLEYKVLEVLIQFFQQ